MSKAIIAMAVHDTVENGRTDLTAETLHNLFEFGILQNYDVYCIDNNSCDATKRILNYHAGSGHIKLITNEINIGTAEAVNKAWKHRKPYQHAVKMDNDVVIHSSTWVEEMIEAIEREPKIGIIGLKRKDCWENPTHSNPDLRSELIMLNQQAGQKWIIVERAVHIIGTCQMYSAALLEKMGYLYQPSLYGYDDVLASHRSTAAGFWNVFLPHIVIDHIDPGGTEYQSWKEKHSSEVTAEMIKLAHGYLKGEVSIYYEPK